MNFLYLLYDAAAMWLEKESGYYSAAFSYYAPLALIPFLFFTVAIVGFFYGETFTGDVLANWGAVLGDDLVVIIKSALANFDVEARSSGLPIIGGVFFLGFYIVALNIMSDGFQKLWNQETQGLKMFFIKSLRSAAFIFVIQLYLIVVIGVEFFIVPTLFGSSSWMSSAILFISTSAFFTILYRWLSQKSPSWEACWIGSIVSSLLFILIKNLVDIYIATTPVLTLYGTAGLILILLVWVYIFASLINYGAAVAGLYGKIRIPK